MIVREAGSFVYSPDLFLSRLALPTHTAEPPSQVCAVVLVILARGSVFFLSVQSLYVPVSDERRERATARKNKRRRPEWEKFVHEERGRNVSA